MHRFLNDLFTRLSESSSLTDVYGTVRSALALITAATLCCSSPSNFFTATQPIQDGSGAAYPWNLFVLIQDPSVAHLLAVCLLLVVASGWRPRITGLIHLWVALSLTHSPAVIDGGEHVTQALVMLMLPLTLLDSRKWHWQPAKSSKAVNAASTIVWFGIRLQVCLIYLEAGIAKLGVPEWRGGTALYYWSTDPMMGAGPWVRAILEPILHQPLILATMTWSVLVLELGLAAALIAAPVWRRRLLVLGLAFHAAIIPLHGITSFALIMMGALILYLRDPSRPFSWRFAAKLRSTSERRELAGRPDVRLLGVATP